ncbi:hypothetical protein [Helicobacter rodentium]|uniref:hypothetical protein n=1 Tax=Helicobacter rodentium TaxID=59617 RepID=UPI0025A51C3C|nr:hypothetical protein [Helicobacter rodentium]
MKLEFNLCKIWITSSFVSLIPCDNRETAHNGAVENPKKFSIKIASKQSPC